MTLRIGIDAWPLAAQPTGIGRYVRELCLALAPRLGDAEVILYSPRAIVLPALPRWSHRAGSGTRLPGVLWLKALLPRQLAADPPDVFWATRTLAPRLPAGTALVATAYDLNHRVAPEAMQPLNRWAHRLWYDVDVRRANAVVAISQGTADRLAMHVGRAADAVAHPAVSPQFRRPAAAAIDATLARLGVARPYLLAVGTREPRKNLATLIDAHARLRASGAAPPRLVIAGAAGWGAGAAGDAVRQLGYVADEDLPALYAGAAAFVFPSLYEGFGMPVLEARACGTRVVASDVPEIREAGGPSALYVPPTVEGLAAGISAALKGPPQPADTFSSWEDSADVLARVLRAAARR